ncbi:MAG: hypothetical protein IJ944_02970 [Clostridia bacterium]|nr:hypothetical protein [Clostridia bacterium]
MENKVRTKSNEYYVVDITRILRFIWQKIGIVILVSVLTAGIGFSMAAFLIPPSYSSSILLYVNNTAFSMNDIGFSISSSEISAAQSLVKTYSVLLKNRTTLERVKAETGLSYTWEEMYYMIEAKSEKETEVMKVIVTCGNASHAAKIANGIATVLPQRVAEIVEGSSMEVVDSAQVNGFKVAPSTTKYTALGLLVGAIGTMAILAIITIMDNTIHEEEYIVNTYDYPILAKIPNLIGGDGKKYGKYGKYGYYYKYESKKTPETTTPETKTEEKE